MEKLMQTYYKKLENYFWDYLVPPSGQAETAQGEINSHFRTHSAMRSWITLHCTHWRKNFPFFFGKIFLAWNALVKRFSAA